MNRRVVITGMGVVAACGNTIEQVWQAAVTGQSHATMVRLAEVGSIAAAVVDDDYATEPGRAVRLGVEAATEALAACDGSRNQVACYISGSKNGAAVAEQALQSLVTDGPESISASFFKQFLTNAPGTEVARKFKLGRPCISVGGACATGTLSLALAADHISTGREQMVVAGAAEASITPLMVAGFRSMGVLTKNEYMQPFDKQRDGFVIGEGAGALLLESVESARKPAVPVYAELVGWAYGCDFRNMIGLSDSCEITVNVIKQALNKARICPSDIDYISVHGTGTVANDVFETRVLHSAFGNTIQNIPVSSTKPVTGHMLGATGAVETIITVQALQHGLIPPTANLCEPDPECALCHVLHAPLEKKLTHALVLNYGFGGHVAVLVLKRWGV